MLNSLFPWLRCNPTPSPPPPVWPETHVSAYSVSVAWEVSELEIIRLCCNDHFVGAHFDWSLNSWMIPYPIRTNDLEDSQ